MTIPVKASMLKDPHDVLVRRVQEEKSALIHMLETGLRDADTLRDGMERYISFQIACDVVGGYDNWKVTFE